VSTLSTHVLDVERGAPAAGVRVELSCSGRPLASGQTDADGRISELASLETSGAYVLSFDVAAYFQAQGRAAPFLRRVHIEFQAAASDRHYHVPLLLSPFAATCYRGS
jgi:5-hydroxyisourate hydrolase